MRIRSAGFAARKTLEEFDWDAQPAVRQQIAALASGGFLTEARNVVLLGPPGTGKTHLATGLGIAAANHGHRVLLRPRPNGSPGSPTPTAPASSPKSSAGCGATG